MRNNKEKVITIAALVIAVIGLSIGFAAFASTLNISTSAHVTPESGTTNSKMVKVRIEYPSNAPHADGGLVVNFGSVEMIFASLSGYVPQQQSPQIPDTPTQQENSITFTTAQIASGQYASNMFLVPVSSIANDSQIENLLNNSSQTGDQKYFNDTECSVNGINDSSSDSSMDYVDNYSNAYFIHYVVFDDIGYFIVMLRLGDTFMTDENYNQAPFSNVTFTITGAN